MGRRSAGRDMPRSQEQYRDAHSAHNSVPAFRLADDLKRQRQNGQRHEIQSRTSIEHVPEITPKIGERKDVTVLEPSGVAGPCQQGNFQAWRKLKRYRGSASTATVPREVTLDAHEPQVEERDQQVTG
jgi:hypothetical protein